ncbi:methyltransferase [Dichotomopilus funicola]|uniref:Methyltransferase n=1 Tax=Dichotomopilus funicola TaxID=1934379 RepID=A0AAN6UXH0_9PEZI|nr:methyltransferase [Dichotomopilus funicola]
MANVAKGFHKLFNNFRTPDGTDIEELFLDHADRVSSPLALAMLAQMGLTENTNTPFTLFENAAGVGVVAHILQRTVKAEVLGKSKIICGDSSEQVLGFATNRSEKEKWVNTEVKKIDAEKTGFDNGTFTHVATNLGFHVIPDSESALNDAIRILKPGGVLGLTTVHRDVAWLPEFREAFKSFPFEAPLEMGLQTTTWGNWSDVNWIQKTLEEKGLEEVNVEVFAWLNRMDSVDYFLTSYGMILDIVMDSCWSKELRKQHPREEVHGLVKAFLEKKYGDKGWNASWIGVVATGRVPI